MPCSECGLQVATAELRLSRKRRYDVLSPRTGEPLGRDLTPRDAERLAEASGGETRLRARTRRCIDVSACRARQARHARNLSRFGAGEYERFDGRLKCEGCGRPFRAHPSALPEGICDSLRELCDRRLVKL